MSMCRKDSASVMREEMQIRETLKFLFFVPTYNADKTRAKLKIITSLVTLFAGERGKITSTIRINASGNLF